MIIERFLAGRRQDELSPEELAALEAMVERTIRIEPRALAARHGEPMDHSMLLIEGVMCRVMASKGERQIVGLHFPGDFVDLHAFPLRVLDHDLVAMNACTMATFKHSAIETLIERFPNLGRQLWFSTLLDAAMHREWIFRLGRLNAIGRVAHLLAESERRLRMVGLSDDGAFDLPLQQTDVASICGITPVHANRVLRSLREQGLATFAGGKAKILDLARLADVAEFDDDYLYPSTLQAQRAGAQP